MGINVNIALIETTDAFKRLANGVSWEKLSFQTQQQIRLMGILEQVSTKFGTSIQQNTNFQMMQLTANLKNISLNIGQAFLPIARVVLPMLNALALALSNATSWLASFANTLFGTNFTQGAGAVNQIGVSAGGASSGLGDMADSADDAGNAVKKAGKAAKGALASFDEINSLSKDTASGGAGGGSGSGAGAGGGATSTPTSTGFVASPINQKMVDAVENFKKALQPTIDALDRLKKALEPFGKFVGQGLKDFYELVLKPIGKWVLGEGLPRFIDAISKGLEIINWARINASLSELFKALEPFALTIGEGLLWFWENVLVPIGAWTTNNIAPIFLNILASTITILNEVILSFKPLASWLFDNFLKPIAAWTGGVIIGALTGLSKALESVSDWMKGNRTVVSGITNTVVSFFAAWKGIELMAFIQTSGGVIAALKAITTALVAGTAAKIADKFQTVALTLMYAKDFIVSIAASTVAIIKQTAAFVASKVAIAAGAISQGAMTAATVAWNIVCATGTALTTAFGIAVGILTSPVTLVIAAIAALVVGIVLLVKNWDTVKVAGVATWVAIKDAWNGAGKWFNTTIVDPIGKAFSDMWKGVSTVCGDTWTTIKGTVKNGINGVIDSINGMISGINNKLQFDLPDVLGGGNVSFSIPRIPRLARGGIVDRATNFGNFVAGEAGKEMIVPLENTPFVDKLASALGNAVMQAMQFSNANAGNSASNSDRELVLEMEGTRFARVIVPEVIREIKRLGLGVSI